MVQGIAWIKNALPHSPDKITRPKKQMAKRVLHIAFGHVAELVGIEGGVVSGVFNLESSGV
jgi:hypothetical protein